MGAAVLLDCLQPLVKKILLSLFGDLEAVWADAGLQKQLLGLSLHAMELLLSCTRLKVATEDTVLYTAQQYVDNLEGQEQQQRARQQLAPHIRCPELSRFWLSGSVNADDAGDKVLCELRPLMRRLLLLRDAQAGYQVKSADVRQDGALHGAPPSWLLGREGGRQVSSVQVVWQLPVSAIREAARSSVGKPKVLLLSPVATPPLGGVAFRVALCCRACPRSRDELTRVGLFVGPRGLHHGMHCMFTADVEVEGFATRTVANPKTPSQSCDLSGKPDFFGVAMRGGWEELAWARAGLPTSGTLTIKATVRGVPHAPNAQGQP